MLYVEENAGCVQRAVESTPLLHHLPRFWSLKDTYLAMATQPRIVSVLVSVSSVKGFLGELTLRQSFTPTEDNCVEGSQKLEGLAGFQVSRVNHSLEVTQKYFTPLSSQTGFSSTAQLAGKLAPKQGSRIITGFWVMS